MRRAMTVMNPAVHWDMVNIQREDWGGGEIWF